MSKLHFELVTPEKQIASREVHMVVVPGEEGDFGVLVGHAPMMSTIRDGELSIYADANSAPEKLSIRGGFAEVNDKGLTILAESVG
jgi:F-type H+-transporting ATPase subunit epsilon